MSAGIRGAGRAWRAGVAVIVALAAALALAPLAAAGPIVDAAAAALRSDPVYVHPDAEETLSQGEKRRLRRQIDDANAGPIYLAVLPEQAAAEAGGDASGVVVALREAIGVEGTYAVYVGGELRADSDFGDVREVANAAAAEKEGPGPTLSAFVDGVGRLAAGEEGGGGGSGVGALVVPLLAVGGIGFFLYRRKRRRNEEAVAFAEVRRAAQDDLLALADDIRALDLDIEMPGVPAEARGDYEQALDKYEEADRALDRARRPEDLERVSFAVEEGRFAMACAKARLEGRELPERRPPCFFDPRHGPSSRDVEWSPQWGAPRLVPACEADAQMVERGLEPSAREVMVGGRSRPYWDAPAAYGPWAGGYFGGFGGLFPGIMLGSMLGGAFHPPVPMDHGDGGFGGGGDWDGGGSGFGGDFGGFGGGD
ncbi:MAG: hypothetical protein KY396_02435 [Actinobacteria bacterium]|nr:hypothetical protein [Actinomycetota bacterium]